MGADFGFGAVLPQMWAKGCYPVIEYSAEPAHWSARRLSRECTARPSEGLGQPGGGGAGTSHGTKTHRQRIEHFLHVIVCSREARLTREQRMHAASGVGRTDNHVRAHLLDESRVGRACAKVGLQPAMDEPTPNDGGHKRTTAVIPSIAAFSLPNWERMEPAGKADLMCAHLSWPSPRSTHRTHASPAAVR
jgi:hypothetical protein